MDRNLGFIDFYFCNSIKHFFVSFAGSCPGNCNGQGKCLSNGICQCENGYTGIDCSTGDVIFLIEPDNDPSKYYLSNFALCYDMQLFVMNNAAYMVGSATTEFVNSVAQTMLATHV